MDRPGRGREQRWPAVPFGAPFSSAPSQDVFRGNGGAAYRPTAPGKAVHRGRDPQDAATGARQVRGTPPGRGGSFTAQPHKGRLGAGVDRSGPITLLPLRPATI